MFTSTRLFYIIWGALGGAGAGGYVAWAIASRFARIAELNDRAIVEPHVLVVLCIAGGLLAFPLGAAAGLIIGAVVNRVFDGLRRARGGSDETSWVARRTVDDGSRE